VELLISFNFDDVHLAEALRASLFVLEPEHQFILSPASYGAVLFKENIAAGVDEADAFLLLIGPQGISSWQKIEFAIARERNKRDRNFPLVAVLAAHSRVPADLVRLGLNWLELPVLTDRTMLSRLLSEVQNASPGRPKIVRSANKDFLREN
jgi:hypothetical protein